MTKERLLVEEFLPIQAINAQSGREKAAGRDYHISTLHPWWARRPLAAVRAAVLASLVPADRFPVDREEVERFFTALTRWKGDEAGLATGALKEAREMVRAAWPGGPPAVVDTFAGGCAIPLEALRLGAKAAAVELNPVAYLIGLGTIVWPQQYGKSLAEDVERWGAWVRDRALEEVSDLYPDIVFQDPEGAKEQLTLQVDQPSSKLVPLVYLWTRTVRCPNPSRAEHFVPLIRSAHVVRTARKRIALEVVPHSETAAFTFRFVPEGAAGAESRRRGRSSASACPLCGAHIDPKYLKKQGDEGGIGFQLVGLVCKRPGRQGKVYLSAEVLGDVVPEPEDIERRLGTLADEGLTVPNELIEPMGNAGLKSGKSYLYGIKTFGDVFTRRQLVSLLTLCKYVRAAREGMEAEGMDVERANVVAAYLGMIVNRVVDRSTSLARWNLGGEKLESPWVRDRLSMMWDFGEVNPFAGISGDYSGAVESVTKVIRHCASAGDPADLHRGSATELPFEAASFDAAVVDPPYYDNISYANSSDFYYVWLKRTIGQLFSEHFGGPAAPKKKEIIAAAYRHGNGNEAEIAARKEYEDLMTRSFEELRRVLKPEAPVVVVYTHQTTSGWSALIQSLRRAGFAVVEAWPIDTEMGNRRGGQDNASLASSIFLVGRVRESEETGYWEDIEGELERVVEQRIDRLSKMGVTGPDLVIASVGAGLAPYTKFRRVELPNGDPMRPAEYLDEVQTLVIKTLVSEVMEVDPSGVESIDPVTQLYVVGRFEYGEAAVPFDEMNTLVHGVLAGARGGGMELLGPNGLTHGAGALVEKDGDSVRLRDFEERGSVEGLGVPADGERPALVDTLHRLLWLASNRPQEMRDFLMEAELDVGALRLLAQALAGSTLSDKGIGTSAREQDAARKLLAAWRHLVEENIFARRS
jgi:putative DNA methylase